MKLDLGQRIGLSVLLGKIIMTSDTTKSLAIKLLIMGLTALAAHLHISVPDAQIYAFATDAADAAVLLYGWYRSFGMKLVPHNSTALDIPPIAMPAKGATAQNITAKVVGALLALLFLPAMIDAARASDIASPASSVTASPACTPLACTGWYVGGGIGGAGSNADIIGNGINGSVFAGGSIPFANAGYQYAQGNWLFGAEGGLGYQLSSSVTINGAGNNTNGMFAYQIFEAGGNVAALLGNSAPITIPPALANALINVYGFVGLAEHQFAGGWASGTASGAGAKFDIGPSSFIDLKYMNVQYGATKTGSLSLSAENLLLVSYEHKF